MAEPAQFRCRVCGSMVPIVAEGALVDACASCSRRWMHAPRRRPDSGGVLAKTIALLHVGRTAQAHNSLAGATGERARRPRAG